LGEDVGEGAGNEALACKRSNAERNARYITWGRGEVAGVWLTCSQHSRHCSRYSQSGRHDLAGENLRHNSSAARFSWRTWPCHEVDH
jgi:hypothetical protein